ncbi:MAG: hypothetical protein JWM64_1057 [Frankiales bacterium]|nr:hypothetical protein [Frankiales bacterium]
MTDLTRLLHDALPEGATPLDLAAVAARSRRLTVQRRVRRGVGTVFVLSVSAVAFGVLLPAPSPDRLDEASPATPRPTALAASSAVPTPSAHPAPPAEACRHIRLAAAQYDASTARPDFRVVPAELAAAWREGRTSADEEFVRQLVKPGDIAPGYTQTLGDASSRLAALCGLTPSGLKAPKAQRLSSTDEFGAVTKIVRTPDGNLRVSVDRVDWLQGQEADAAAAADGTDAGDYHVVNDNPTTRSYDVSPDAVVYGSIMTTGAPDLSNQTLSDWADFLRSGSRSMSGANVRQQILQTYWHFQVEDRQVIGIEEQYRP